MKTIALHPVPFAVGVAFACAGLSEAQTLLFEDFESGGEAWTMAANVPGGPPGPSLWHISMDGECGAATRMGAYNRPSECDFRGSDHGVLISPEFICWPSMLLEFDYRQMMDSSAPYGGASLYLGRGNEWILLSAGFADTDTVQHVQAGVLVGSVWGVPPWWAGLPVRLAFSAGVNYFENPESGDGFGWMVDNVVITSRPLVQDVSPDHGTNGGLAGVVISGIGFLGATEVRFGPNPSSFTVDSDFQITVNLGATTTTGFVDVAVTKPTLAGTLAAGVRTNGFDYFSPPSDVSGACSAPYLSWSGAPILGEVYTVTTENLNGASQVLLVDWSSPRLGTRETKQIVPGLSPKSLARIVPCSVLHAPDMSINLGTASSYTFSIPIDPALIGAHLWTQARVLRTPGETTQILDATIGE